MQTNVITNIISAVGFIAIGLLIGWLIFPNGEISSQAVARSDEIWTCSMHPQVQQKEPGQCPLCGMDLIKQGSQDNNPIRFEMTPEAVKLAAIETAIVGDSLLKNAPQREILVSGKVQINPSNNSIQTSHISGRIEALYVNYEGEKIKAGQKIAEIYSAELIAAQKELLEAYKMREELPSLYEAARAKIEQWKIQKSFIDRIIDQNKIVETIEITAERSGIIMRKILEKGDYVKAGQGIYQLMDLNKVWVSFDVYEKDLKWVSLGQIIEFNLSAMPERSFRAPISFIDPILNPQSRTASIRVEVSNPSEQFKPDMFAKGVLKIREKIQNVKQLAIPKSSVLWTGEKSVVYIKVPETDIPTYEYKTIEILSELENSYLIGEGLQIGDEIVVHGTFRLDAAAQLNNKKSMMNQHIGIKGQVEKLPNYHKDSPENFKNSLQDFTETYIELKDLLVATDYDKSIAKAKNLAQKFEAIDMKLLEGKAHNYWMKISAGLKAHLQSLQKAKDVEATRKEFSNITELLAKSIKVYGLKDAEYYLQHCPMAFDNAGANWLSKERKILNPYFGDKMLTCGLVKDSLN